MNEVIENVTLWLPVIGILLSVVSSIVAVCKGKSTSKAKSKLTQVEQENDVYDYMVSECSRVEVFSAFLKNSMSKEQLSEYKKNEVLKNVGLYAQSKGYTWYSKAIAEKDLEDYITNANTASGKTITVTPNAG